MQRLTYDFLLDQVKAIYHAVTGADLPRTEWHQELPPGPDAADQIAARFAELEAFSRLLPGVSARVPPFAFTPPVDVVDHEKELLIEVAVPGITAEAIEVKIAGDLLVISGVREWEARGNGRFYRYAEIPRGPFRRVVVLPSEVAPEPARVEVANGLVRIRLSKIHLTPVAKA